MNMTAPVLDNVDKWIAYKVGPKFKELIDIHDVVGRFLPLRKENNRYRAVCPFHDYDGVFNLILSRKEQRYGCVVCGAQGDSYDFIGRLLSLEVDDAVRYAMKEFKTIALSNKPKKVEENQKKRALTVHSLLTELYHSYLCGKEGVEALHYLTQERGITMETINTFKIGYAPERWDYALRFLTMQGYSKEELEEMGVITRKEKEGRVFHYDTFRGRIMFPIHNAEGKTVAFGGRRIDDQKPKYLNSKETAIFSKRDLLFNYHRVQTTTNKETYTVLYEGYMDVVMAWQSGFKTGLASMGTAITPSQAVMIKQLGLPVISCYDGDEAGQRATHKALDVLQEQQIEVSVAMLPENLDPDEYIRRYSALSFEQQLSELRLPVVDYHVHRLGILQPITHPLAFKAQLDGAIHIYVSIENEALKKQYGALFAAHFNMTIQEFEKQCLL